MSFRSNFTFFKILVCMNLIPSHLISRPAASRPCLWSLEVVVLSLVPSDTEQAPTSASVPLSKESRGAISHRNHTNAAVSFLDIQSGEEKVVESDLSRQVVPAALLDSSEFELANQRV